MRGNLVLSPLVFREVIARQADHPGKVLAMQSTDDAHSGIVAAGALSLLIDGGYAGTTLVAPVGLLPFALNGEHDEVREAELQLARANCGSSPLERLTLWPDGRPRPAFLAN